MSASVNLLAALLLLAAAAACAAGDDPDPSPAVSTEDAASPDSVIGRVAPMLNSPADGRRASFAPQVTAERSRLIGADTLGVGADGRPSTELSGVSYRWWLSRGRSDVGVGVGALGRVITQPPGVIDGGTSLAGSVPTVTVGWRYRVTNDSVVFADASGARGLGLNGNGNYVSTKLGAEWKSPVSRFGLDKRGHLGVRLDSGYRMSLRVRKSGIGVYVRGQF